MNTKKEPDELKEEVETVSKKLHELTEDELKQVSGGGGVPNTADSDVVVPGGEVECTGAEENIACPF